MIFTSTQSNARENMAMEDQAACRRMWLKKPKNLPVFLPAANSGRRPFFLSTGIMPEFGRPTREGLCFQG
ncbi:hypothetical protein CO670_01690 [Rhizobium sp. J15]|nr:hypothetical protein CO670_01690 [Rhizobium sp. J15]